MLQFTIAPDGAVLTFTPRRLLIAGYTGRDQAAVAQHIAELRAHGIPAPSSTPALYSLTPDRLSTASRLAVVGRQTSGEAEFVLVVAGGELLLGVGSDHTDRDLERLSVPRAKQVCPKALSSHLWRWAAVEADWDRFRLRSWIDGMPYQDGAVSELMRPDAVLALGRERVGALDDAVIYCGTLPLLDGELRFGHAFAAALVDPVGGQELRCEYTLEIVDDLD